MHIRQEKPYDWGYTAITEEGKASTGTMMDFGVLRLRQRESSRCRRAMERAFLLLEGSVRFTCGDQLFEAQRRSIFDENPVCLHVPRCLEVTVEAQTDVELVVVRTINDADFPTRFFSPNDTRSEHRGAGTMQETSTRIVRTIFDKTNAPDANLVLGEVINFPGKWSSYPPHHHIQPEIYHYRFLPEQGFGACVIGDDIYKVKHRSTTLILEDKVHPQTSAPGYAMFYVWAIRHLEGDPYVSPDYPVFDQEHTWVMQEDAVIFPDRRD